MDKRRRVHVLLMWPHRYVNFGIPWTAAAIADAFRGTALDPIFYMPQPGEPLPKGLKVEHALRVRLPGWLGGKHRMHAFLQRRIERKFLRAVRAEGPGALAWLWPIVPVHVTRRLKAGGAIVVREMVNSWRGTARRVLDAETARTGLPSHIISETDLAEENEEFTLVDYIVSPSEAVDASLIEAGVGENRIIRSTFAWDSTQLADQPAASLPGKGPHALFVGSVGVRKGVHLALEAWQKADTGGTFVVVGAVDPMLRPLLDAAISEGGVEWIPFTRELGSLYRSADFMLFPTLEEGAPLVCYQAAGCGLPILTGPMGAGRFIENEVSGLIVDPNDQEALVGAIRRMAGDSALRQRLAAEAKRRADRLTWANAAAERARQLLQKIGDARLVDAGV